MKNKKSSYKICCVLLLTAIFFILSKFSVFAESKVPVQSYTYWENMSKENSRKTVFTKELFNTSTVFGAAELGLPSFTKLTDVFVSDDTIYLLDGGESRIILLDKDYNYISHIDSLNLNGEALSFKNAKGIFHKDGLLYVCDTENERVLVADEKGKVVRTITKPDSPLIPEGFSFLPTKVNIDSQGYLYILSEGSFYGLLLFSENDEFVQFFAANDVMLNITETIDKIIERVIPNNKKKSASAKVLPFSVVDFCIDSNDFIYTSTGATGTSDQKGQIKKLYYGNGKNILDTSDKNYIDEGINSSTDYGKVLGQNLTSIDVDSNDFVYCLDSAFGRVFVYDEKGTLLSTFGGGVGNGNQEGTFVEASALAVNDTEVIVLDSFKNSVTVFSPTELGEWVKSARQLSLKGKYTKAKPIWESVLKKDRNCQMAYSGLSRAYLAEKNYQKALEYSKLGYDRDTYSLAFKEVRGEFLEKYFSYLFVGGLLLIIGVTVSVVVCKKKKLVIIKNEEVKLMSSSLFSPINTFTTIKEKQKGSIIIGLILVFLFYIFTVLNEICGGFLFVYFDAKNYNSILVFAKSVGLVFLWILANWLVCTLSGGIGKVKEIIVVISYSLIPLILNLILRLFLTNVLLSDEGAFLGILNAVAYILFFLMVTFGSMIIHDYSFKKFVVTSIFSIVGMAIVVFLLILMFILFQQFSGFLQTVIKELMM